MSEPDFDQIAEQLTKGAVTSNTHAEVTAVIREAFRQVWNARGAADVDAVAADRVSDAALGWIATVIRELDR